MSIEYHNSAAILSQLGRVIEIVADRRQGLDEAISAQKNLTVKALRSGVPVESLAKTFGVRLEDIELLIGTSRFRALRYFSPPDHDQR